MKGKIENEIQLLSFFSLVVVVVVAILLCYNYKQQTNYGISFIMYILYSFCEGEKEQGKGEK